MLQQTQRVEQIDAVIQNGSRSFAFASELLPREVRDNMRKLYSWCRFCDDVVDGQDDQPRRDRATNKAMFDYLRERTEAAFDDSFVGPLLFPFESLREARKAADIPFEYAELLLNGQLMDVQGKPCDTIHDTVDYAYHVAGSVGLMAACVLQVEDEKQRRLAADLGIAFQLTNIARDLCEDAGRERCYVPSDWLERSGLERIDESTFATAFGRSKVFELAKKLLLVADEFYDRALEGVRALPARSACSIATALLVYREIGVALVAAGPDAVASRATVNTARKLQLLCSMPLVLAGKRLTRFV